jgi:hypothetical protein
MAGNPHVVDNEAEKQRRGRFVNLGVRNRCLEVQSARPATIRSPKYDRILA